MEVVFLKNKRVFCTGNQNPCLTEHHKIVIVLSMKESEKREKPYYALDYYLREQFGGKVYKVALNAGMSCPNRDGTIGYGGCIFCSAGGSGDFAGDVHRTMTDQIAQGIEGTKKFKAERYIAYFQAFTNTYAPIERLEAVYKEAIVHEQIAALSIATRPDCISEEVIALLTELNTQKPVWVELGLQTIHEQTAQYIRRGYGLDCFAQTVQRLSRAGLTVIVHVILGLPGESREDMLETISYLNHCPIQGIKLQLLHVLQGTDLAAEYEAHAFEVLEFEEYIQLVCDCIGYLRSDIVVHRITGDGPKDLLIAPLWSTAKRKVMNAIHHQLRVRSITQGCFLTEAEGGMKNVGADGFI